MIALLALCLAQEPAAPVADPAAPAAPVADPTASAAASTGELPPAVTDVPHAEAPAGAPGGAAVTTGRGLLIRLTDAEGRYPSIQPRVELESPGGAKQAYAMRDDGEQPDNMAGDRSFAAVAQIGADKTLTLRLYDGEAGLPPLYEAEVTLDLDQPDLDVILFAEAGGFRVQAGRPPQPGADAGEGAGLLGSGGGGLLGGADPQSGGQASPGGGVGLGVAGIATLLSTGLVAILVGVPALGVGFFLGRRRAAGARPLDGARGHPLLDGGALALVVPPGEEQAVVVAMVEALGQRGPVLLLPAAERRAGTLAGVAARTANATMVATVRPEAKAVARHVTAAAAVVVDGPGALEATLSDEAADTVMNELIAACPRACVVVAQGAPVPAKAARTVVLEVDPGAGETGGLVGGGLRLSRVAGELRLAAD